MRRVIPTILLLALGFTITVGAGPAMADEVTDVIKALKHKKDKVSADAFKRALTLLSTEHRDSRQLREAAARYLKTRKGFLGKTGAVMAIGNDGSENALALLVPYLKHKDPRMRQHVLDSYARSKPYRAFLRPLQQRAKAEKAEGPLRTLVKALAAYGQAHEEAFRSLNRLVTHKEAVIRVLAILAAAHPANKALSKQLVTSAQREKNLLIRSAAILGLGRMNAKEALPALKTIRKQEEKNAELVSVLDATIDILQEPPGAKADELYVAALDMEIKRIQRAALATARKDDPRAAKTGDGKGQANNRRGRSGAGCDGR